MAKRSSHVCQQCGYSQVGWAGKCPNCGTWGSLVETLVQSSAKSKSGKSSVSAKSAVSLKDVKVEAKHRVSTQISELDRVLGSGLVSGQVILLAGEPGIGKSTILLQVASNLKNCFYVSGEESATQVKIRSDRLGVKASNILFLESNNIDEVISSLESIDNPDLVIIDSIQTMATSDLSGLAGSVGQVRECASRLVSWAKSNGVPVIMVGHVTKSGSMAGPAVLAHIVDTVLWFEGDSGANLRILRGIKNRFGPTDEVGIFTMEAKGLVSVEDASAIFLGGSVDTTPGNVVTAIMEGSRPVLVEIQSLVVSSKTAYPRRVTQGVDAKRVEMILGILAKRAGIPALNYDVYVNVAGGIKVNEPASDLAVALSIACAYKDKSLPKGSVVLGELGLSGEIRAARLTDKRVKESKRQGYKVIISDKDFKFLNQATKKLL